MKAYSLRFLFIWCFLLITLSAPAQQQKKHKTRETKETPEAQLLQHCRDMFLKDHLNNPERTKVATRYFDAMPSETRTRRLVSLRKSLYRGTSSYSSVAYMLAYYGVEVPQNLSRMLDWVYPPKTTPAAVLAKAEAEDKWFDDGQVWGPVGVILRKHPSDALVKQVFKMYFVAEEHGSASESPGCMLADCFLLYPSRTLHMALKMKRPDHAIEDLAFQLATEGGEWIEKEQRADYSKVRAALKKLANSQDLELARAARQCSRLFEKEAYK